MTDQQGSINWYLSADGGDNWSQVEPDNEWVDLSEHPGSEFLWKAELQFPDGVPPFCYSIYIEYDSGWAGVDDGLPKAFALHRNTPNPFNPMTTLRYDVPAPGGEVSVAVYDVAGRLVRTLVDGEQTPGRWSTVWDGRDEAGTAVASGVYYCRMKAPGYERTMNLTLLK